jgi:DNA-binding winged helix-turn-helix (wHTH) protein
MAALGAPRRVKFGDFIADFHSFELHKHGIRLKLHGQPLQILKALLERPGQLVTREELRMELWTQSTFVDFDAGLNAAIRRLREALNDSAEEPRYIETLPRLGYRFIAEVADPAGTSETATPEVGNSDPASLPVTPKPFAEALLLPVVAVATVLILVLLFGDSMRSLFASRAMPPIRSIAVLPLANLSGDSARDLQSGKPTGCDHDASLKVESIQKPPNGPGSTQPTNGVVPEACTENWATPGCFSNGSDLRGE